jgi:hypothetical protein
VSITRTLYHVNVVALTGCRPLYEHAFVGNAGSDYGYFQRALKAGQYASAWQFAKQLPSVSLADALALTVLAAEHDPDHFDAMALRWLSRLIDERALTLEEFAEATAELQGVSLGLSEGDGLRALLKAKPMKGSI